MMHRPEAIVIGGSAGAVDALLTILPALPKDYPVPILVVVHLPPKNDNLLPEVMQMRSALSMREAEDKEPIAPATTYFAPPNYHLLVEQDRTLALSADEPLHFCRPAVDVLFESASDVFGKGLIGIVLTGANEDGAAGLQAVLQGGGTALVQKPETAQSPEMPQAALDMCPNATALSLEEITHFLQQFKRGAANDAA